ncbi:MAG: fibronectin type III-like domain-contianing protein, partial [Flavobacteriaceae bacterium]|nr:fibronectin type III-like domain-contianing protein [Flavobacteriaceae bacterium]
VGSLTRPIKELKGFEKVMLKAGETKKINFTVGSEELQFYTANKKWEVEPGDFKIFVGGDSVNTLEASLTVID